MPDIKTRDIAKGTIKTIDKSAVAAERMKSAFIQTKEKAEHSVDVPKAVSRIAFHERQGLVPFSSSLFPGAANTCGYRQ